jgi:hypothetical protein
MCVCIDLIPLGYVRVWVAGLAGSLYSVSDVIECLATFRDIRGISQCLEATVQYSTVHKKLGPTFFFYYIPTTRTVSE